MAEAGSGAPRVALVHDWLTGMRGGEYVLEALAELFPAAPIYTLFHFPGTVSGALERHRIRTSALQHLPLLRRSYRYYLPLFPRAVERFDLSAFDLVLSSSHCVAKGAIARKGAHHLCYCHTPMRYAWDQEEAYFGAGAGPIQRIRRILLRRLREWDRRTSARCDRFVANSRFVAGRIETFYGRAATVVPPPVDVVFFTPDRSAARAGHCLAVAALVPYKRLDLAIAACARAGAPLLVVGDGPQRRALERRAGASVRFLGRVSREHLRDLYRGALCLVQPGIEDFGIAAVEAIACGTPVVARARGGVLDSVTDGTHGVLYDAAPDDSAQLEALAAEIDK